MDVPHFLAEYPAPSPPKTRSKDIFNKNDFTKVDNGARQAPENLLNSFHDLLTYLLKDVTSDLGKVRALFIWLSAQPVLTRQFPKVPKPDTPLLWLKKIKLDRSLYTDFLAFLCRKANVPCVIIEGSSKGAGFEVGQKGPLKITNRWNAVHVQGSWRLVNVPWALVTTDGLADGDWDLVERDGEAVREKEVSNKRVEHDLDEFWFLTEPEDFNPFCHAKESPWQLLKEPWTDEDFLNTPRYAEDLFSSGWELVSQDKAVLTADKGKCHIVFSHDQDAGKVSLLYKLYYNVKLSTQPLPETLQLDRYIVTSSTIGQKKLITRLPQNGIYRMEIAGVLDDVQTVLAEFRIESVNIEKESAPFPEGCSEIGYTEEAAANGLIEPSHEDGIVEAQPGEKVEFSFKLAGRQTQPGDIQAILTQTKGNIEELADYVEVHTAKDRVNVTVQLPPNSENEEYGLQIITRGDDNPTKETTYKNLINYIISSDSALTFPEGKETIESKNGLLKAMKELNLVDFHKYLSILEKKGKLDPLTRSKVDNFLAHVSRTRAGKRQQLLEKMRESHIKELREALANYEMVAKGEATDVISQAKAVISVLEALEQEDNNQSLEAAVQQAYDVKLKNNHNIQKAEKELVSFYEIELTDAYYKRSLDVLRKAFARVNKSIVANLVKAQQLFLKAADLEQHLMEMKQIQDKVGKIRSQDLTKLAGPEGQEPHPHIQSILIATFILLGEREQELWTWSHVQNLLERRGELGVSKTMASLDVNKLTVKQADLAESHVKSCELDVVKSENATAVLFLQWVLMMVEEKRGLDAVRHHHSQIRNV